MRKLYVFLIFILLSGKLYSQSLEWAKTFAGTTWTNETAVDMAIDNSGNVITIGGHDGAMDFDPGPSVYTIGGSGSGSEIYISKLDANGSFVWARTINGTWHVKAQFVEIDNQNNIIVCGTYEGSTTDFDPGTGVYSLPGHAYPCFFVLKLDSAGNFKWAKRAFNSYGKYLTGLCVDSNNDVYICGDFNTSIDFDFGLITSVGPTDGFIAKYDKNGPLEWVKRIGGAGAIVEPQDITVDTANCLYLTGRFSGTADFDVTTGVQNVSAAGGSSDMFILKLNADFTPAWVHAIGAANGDIGRFIELDNAGNIYITGNFYWTVDFDPSPAYYPLDYNNGEEFISKFTTSGAHVWTRQLNGIIANYRLRIAVDYGSNLYYLAGMQGSLDADPGVGTTIISTTGSLSQQFITKLDPSGDLCWVHQFTDGTSSTCSYDGDVELDEYGNIYICGFYKNSVEFDPGPGSFTFSNPGHEDVYICKWDQDHCYDFSVGFDSASNVSCSTGLGFAIAQANGGKSPYSYTWGTSPVDNDSLAFFTLPGIYAVTAVDDTGCIMSKSILISGFDTLPDFDLNVNLIANTFQSGFNSQITVFGNNNRCDTVSGDLLLILDPMTAYDYAVPAPDTIIGDSLIWNFYSMNYDSGYIIPIVHLVTSSAISMGDSVCFRVQMNPISGDGDTMDNVKQYCFPVINSYDPNDKQVYPQGECPEHFVLNDETLTYTIRFQNTGNADAINIYILDSLDSNLDLNSVNVVGNSHELITEVLPGNVLKFRFDNINLADSTADEANSHGYVIFEVDPLTSLPNNTLIENTSYIYFDFNPAIVTNTVWSTMVDSIYPCGFWSNSQTLQTLQTDIKVYPNPTNSSVTIPTNGFVADKIVLMDAMGRVVMQTEPVSSSPTLNLSTVEPGVYFIQAIIDSKVYTSRLVRAK